MDGMEALDRMIGRYRDVPIILHTSYPQYKEDFISYAADAYVNKSSDLTDLKRVIGDLLKRSLRKN
jgi:CheY-like chemotaxis protein